MNKFLYGASVQGIQEFIFKTNKLQEIVGASEIVKNISRLFEDNFKADKIIINIAGNIKVIFNNKEECEKAVLNFPKMVMKKAYGITISQAVIKFDDGELKEAFQKLEKNLFIQRNKASILPDMSINIIKLAPKTARPVVEGDKDRATIQKEEANISQGNIPKNKKNKTAVIHVDGNGLGAMIASMLKELQTDKEVIKAYKEFSDNLDKATTEAYKVAKKDIKDKDIKEIILGGDDVSVICNADVALDFTNIFLEEFETQTKKLLGKDGLSACAGVAYCNHKYPFHYAINLAESLCGYAKEHSKKIDKNLAPSSLMFHNIQSSNFESFKEYQDKELILKNDKEIIHLTYGPYFIQEQTNYSTIKAFLNLSEAFKLKGSPISRLREWLTILGQNSAEAKERLLRINDMMDLRDDIFKKQSLENSFRVFNINIKLDELTFDRDEEKYTPMGDIINYLSVINWSKK